MKAICGIYKITSPSRKVYIGQSVNIHRRIYLYKNHYCKSQARLYNSIKKYGWDKHIFEIICQCPVKELNEKEEYYVDLYQSCGVNGLNCRNGGGSKSKHSAESIEKMRQSKLGRPSSRKGVHLSDETKAKLRAANLGKKVPQEVRDRIRATSKGRIITDTHRKNISNGLKGSKQSKEHAENNRLAQIKYAKSESYRHPLKGIGHSDATKLKMKQAWKRRRKCSSA